MVRGSVPGVELNQLVGALENESVPKYAAMHITGKLSARKLHKTPSQFT